MADNSRTGMGVLGRLIQSLRVESNLTQEALAGTEFTRAYVVALEKGAARPSLKALEVFAERMQVPVACLVEVAERAQSGLALDLRAQAEDLQYQFNHVKMLVRAGNTDEAFQLISEIEQSASSYWDELPASIRYLAPFSRGRAYVQQAQWVAAQRELKTALEVADRDEEAVARTNNILGAAYYALGQHEYALNCHIECLRAIDRRAVNDLTFHMGVYYSLGNDYWAANRPEQAIDAYKRALALLEQDIHGAPVMKANILWGLGTVYSVVGDWVRSMAHAMQALDIYENIGNKQRAASMCINLSEGLMAQERYEEAGQLIGRAHKLLNGTDNQGMLSLLYRFQADLARRQGQLEQATHLAADSIRAAEAHVEATMSVDGEREDSNLNINGGWAIPDVELAEALLMAARIEEERGRTRTSDELFLRALKHAQQASHESLMYTISSSYAEALAARREHARASQYYQVALQSTPHHMAMGGKKVGVPAARGDAEEVIEASRSA